MENNTITLTSEEAALALAVLTASGIPGKFIDVAASLKEKLSQITSKEGAQDGN